MIVRAIRGSDRSDAISPYGYPGGEVRSPAEPPPDAGAIDWSATGLVSLFVRERLAPLHCFAAARPRSAVQVHDPARPERTRRRFASQIRRNRAAGLAVEAWPGPRTTDDQRAAFHRAYTETMRRAGAAERYLYDPGYFDSILAAPSSWLVLATTTGGEPCAGAIAVRSDGVLHYYLGGTADAHLRTSPFKNVVARMRELAGELELPLNLGGGVTPGDGLEDFKRGFANAELTFHTHEVVCDPGEYERLAAGRQSGFFPAYRAPA